MPDRDWMIRRALSYDTAMSRAFLRALGVSVPIRHRSGEIVRVSEVVESLSESLAGVSVSARDIAECFANTRSPMDWR